MPHMGATATQSASLAQSETTAHRSLPSAQSVRMSEKSFSRMGRLESIRRKRQTNAADKSVAVAEVSHRAIELTSINPRAETNAAVEGTLVAHHLPQLAAPVQPLTSLEQNRRKRTGVLSIFLLLLSLGCAWMLRILDRGRSLSLIECDRVESFHPVTCLSFLGFFAVATLLRPAKTGKARHALSAVQHRTLFSILNLVFAFGLVCSFASIGYPQGLCPSDCDCGTCAGANLTKDKIVPAQAGHANMSSWKMNNNSCAETEIFVPRRDSGTTCATGGIISPAICKLSADSKRTSRSLLSPNISTRLDATKIKDRIDSMISLLLDDARIINNGDKATLHAYAKGLWLTKSCSRNLEQKCPAHSENYDDYTSYAKNVAPSIVAKLVVPATCDRFYSFCDKDDNARPACSSDACCSICNVVHSIRDCDDEKSTAIVKLLDAYFKTYKSLGTKLVTLELKLS